MKMHSSLEIKSYTDLIPVQTKNKKGENEHLQALLEGLNKKYHDFHIN